MELIIRQIEIHLQYSVTCKDHIHIATLLLKECVEMFKEDRNRRNSRSTAPTLARKLADGQLFQHMSTALNTFFDEDFLLICMSILSCIANEVPTLVGRMLDMKLPFIIINQI